MAITIEKGNLLNAEVDALVNTVNCVGVMGKGIALQFKKKWPAAYKDYKRFCDRKELRPGSMHVHDLGQLAGKPYYIIHFPTKDHWRERSQIHYIKEGLQALVQSIESLGIRSVAIPPLGCGNGGLAWAEVEPLIQSAFAPLSDLVDVQLFAPAGAPIAKELAVRTHRPQMTQGRAILIKLIDLYKKLDYSLSKIEVQKLCYFAQEAGQPLRLNYVKHQFGPYADNLRHVLNHVDGHFVKGVGDHAGSKTELTLMAGVVDEADEFLQSQPNIQSHLKRVQRLIEGYETPLGMELLATVHWVATKDIQTPLYKDVLEGIKRWCPENPAWNERKKQIMTPAQVRVALEHLQSQGWMK